MKEGSQRVVSNTPSVISLSKVPLSARRKNSMPWNSDGFKNLMVCCSKTLSSYLAQASYLQLPECSPVLIASLSHAWRSTVTAGSSM